MSKKQLTLGSLFDGIGGWQIAAIRNGIIPLWSSEIERFPIEVTKVRFPNTTQLGDITKIDGTKIEPVDIICAGSPCQDLSIAGKREGLSGKRSGLFTEAIRIVREMQNKTGGAKPRFFVWENVPGTFSSNKGHDFRAVLEEITKTEIPMPRSGKWTSSGMVRGDECTVEWRTLDAQYFGVPQRRKRIFLVANFAADARSKYSILFESKSLSRDITQGEGERKGVTSDSKRSIGTTGDCLTFDASQSYATILQSEVGGTLKSSGGNYGGGSENYVVGCDVYNHVITGDKACSLTAHSGGTNTAGAKVITTVDFGRTADRIYINPNKSVTIQSQGGGMGAKTGLYLFNEADSLSKTARVRKLTPLECERLQGLPDNYTLIDDKSCSDSARYKAIGNGMAQPCADFILQRITAEATNGMDR